MKRPIVGLINSYYPSLTNSEKKVADYVLNNLNKVIYYSVTDLSYEANVGETTVLRFCRKIGMKGYQEFKLTIAQNISEAEKEEEPESNNLIDTISKNTIKGLEETSSMIREGDLNTAIEMLHEAKSIHFFGVGTSGVTALDAQGRFLRIGKQTSAIVDSHLQAMSASTLAEGDVVVAISISGSTRDTLESLELAKESGAKVIAITYYTRSPITQFADIVLIGGTKESPLEGGSLIAKISQLFVIDLLYTGLALLEKEHTVKMQERTAKAVLNKIY